MNKRETILRQLAKSIIANGTISKDVQKFLENDLSKAETRKLIFFLELELEKKTVTITSADSLPIDTKKQFEQEFSDKKIVYNDDEHLGAGIKVKVGDNVYDYSVRNYIDQTIAKLKE